MALREEAFLDQSKIESYSGVSFGVNRPVKQGNIYPSLPSDGSVPHWGTGFLSCHQVGSITRIFYAAMSDPNITYLHHGYAEWDGADLTFPSQGLVSYNGSTDNNLITPGGYTRNQYFTSWDEVGEQYVCMVIVSTSPRTYAIYTSPSMPPSWTLVKTFTAADFGLPVTDISNMWRRSDGRAATYYQEAEAVSPAVAYGGWLRHTGLLLGPADGSLTGTWTNAGRVLTAPSVYEQLYYPSAWVDGELVYVPVCMFDGDPAGPPPGHTIDGTRNRIWKTNLYVGRADDGTDLTLVDSNWVAATGVGGEWDGGELGVAQTIARDGDTWKLPLWGDDDTHHQTPELRRAMGMSHLGYRRVGYIQGPGEVILTTVTAAEAASLTLNSEGTITVELLDSDDQVIPGYSRTDSVPVTTDAFDNPVAWNSHEVTPADFKAVLILAAGARVYFLTAADAAAEPTPDVGLTLDESSIFTQTGTSITARALTGRRSSVPAVAYSLNGGAIWVTGDDVAVFDIDGDPVDGQTAIVLTAGVPLNLELGVTPVNAGPLAIQIGIPE